MTFQFTRYSARPIVCVRVCVCFALLSWMLAMGRAGAQEQKNGTQRSSPGAPSTGTDYSGMYSFLRDGEFVQITVEEKGRVTGFVSRYGESESDRGSFLDHFFKAGKLDGDQLTFTTETVHGVSYEFKGTVERGQGKNRGDEAYYVLKGTLVENTMDDAKKTSSRSKEVTLKGFPRDMSSPS